MIKLEHKNVVRYITSWLEQDTSIDESFNDNEFQIDFSVYSQKDPNSNSSYQLISLFIQMEFCDGISLDKYLMNPLYQIDEKIIFMIFK